MTTTADDRVARAGTASQVMVAPVSPRSSVGPVRRPGERGAGMIGEAPSHIRTHEAAEHDFIVRALRAVDLTESDANDVAGVLVAADLRGVESHGIARLDLFYV